MLRLDPRNDDVKTIRSILVATDLTEASDDVLRSAAGLASLLDAKLHVIHSFDLQSRPYSGDHHSPTFAGRIEQARRTLEDQLRRTTRPGFQIASGEIVIFAAHRAILDRAEAVEADLIVLGPHRRRGAVEEFLGTTTDGVIRGARCPCLIIRGPINLPLRRVVVAVDLSAPSLRALETGLAWADSLRPQPGTEGARPRVEILHVLPPDLGLLGVPLDEDTIVSGLKREVYAMLGKAASTELDVRIDLVRSDDVPGEILARSDRDADLLVLSTHGHGSVARALVGSVASTVARRARCPILVVPPRAIEGS